MSLIKTYIEGISCDVGIAVNPKGTLFLCPGFPEYPRPKKLMEQIAKNNYNVVYIRYSGTFESEGIFLRKSPSRDVIKVMKYLNKNKKFFDLWSEKYIKINLKRIIFVGCSFGANISAEASFLTGNSALSISPMDKFSDLGRFKGEYSLSFLFEFVSKSYKKIYRISKKGIELLISDKLVKTLYELEKSKDRILIIHGKNDVVVNPDRSRNLKRKGFNVLFVNEEHLTFSNISSVQIFRWLKGI